MKCSKPNSMSLLLKPKEHEWGNSSLKKIKEEEEATAIGKYLTHVLVSKCGLPSC